MRGQLLNLNPLVAVYDDVFDATIATAASSGGFIIPLVLLAIIVAVASSSSRGSPVCTIECSPI